MPYLATRGCSALTSPPWLYEFELPEVKRPLLSRLIFPPELRTMAVGRKLAAVRVGQEKLEMPVTKKR